MTLFDDGAGASLERGVRLVRETLQGLPGSFDEDTDDAATVFGLIRDGARVRLTLAPGPAGPVLRIDATPPTAPADPGPELHARLLRANGDGLGGLAWGIVDEEIRLVGERPVADLDPSEVVALLAAVPQALARARALHSP